MEERREEREACEGLVGRQPKPAYKRTYGSYWSKQLLSINELGPSQHYLSSLGELEARVAGEQGSRLPY